MIWRDLENKRPVSYSENLVVTASRLNCRTEPSINAMPLKKLDKDSVVTAVQLERVDGWVKLYTEGTSCWAKEEHLTKQSDEFSKADPKSLKSRAEPGDANRQDNAAAVASSNKDRLDTESKSSTDKDASLILTRQPATLPVVQAYEAWVNQGVMSRKFVRRCTMDMYDGISYPTVLPPTVYTEGQKSVYGDINNDGVTDFIAQVWSIECTGGGNALWNGELIVGVSQGARFSFGRSGDSVYTRYIEPIDSAAVAYGMVLDINAIESGVVSGVFLDNISRIRGRCEGYRGNSNVRRSFKYNVMTGRMINIGGPVIDREWTCEG